MRDGFEYIVRVRLNGAEYNRFVFADCIDDARAEVMAQFEKEPRPYGQEIVGVNFTGRRRVDGRMRG